MFVTPTMSEVLVFPGRRRFPLKVGVAGGRGEVGAGVDPGFCQVGTQFLRLKVPGVVKLSHMSYLQLGSMAQLRALEVFEVLILKYIYILPHSKDSFSVIFDM